MKILYSSDDRSGPAEPAAVAIGNFDGVHLGHQRILSVLAQQASEEGLVPLILTFSPHPGKVTGSGKIQLLQTEKQKLEKMERFGVEAVTILAFDKNLALLSAEEFVRSILIDSLNSHVIVVGENFRFGHDRQGNTALLRRLARKYALTVFPVPSLIEEGETVSSSFIRDLTRNGEVARAARLLGEAYEIRGRVIRGQSLGRDLGFPTANLATRNEIVPNGVYVTTATVAGRTHASITNVGTQPTFSRNGIRIETHILDFAQDIYEADISIRFLKKIREELRFGSPDELREQISEDLLETRRYFARHPVLPSP